MNIFQNKWNQLPPRRRLALLTVTTLVLVVWATFILLHRGGVREVLYKGF